MNMSMKQLGDCAIHGFGVFGLMSFVCSLIVPGSDLVFGAILALTAFSTYHKVNSK